MSRGGEHGPSVGGGTAAEWIDLGVVTSPHGVRGDFKIRLYNPASQTVEQVGPVALALRHKDGTFCHSVSIVTRRGSLLVARTPGVQDRANAEAVCQSVLVVRREALSIEPDEYWVADLIGCAVREKGRDFGLVTDVISAGAGDVLVVGQGAAERLIPLVDEWVETVDLKRKTIEIRNGAVWDALSTGQDRIEN